MDMSMCHGIGCKSKTTCLRHKGRADTKWQSYFAGTPSKQNGECDYYIPYINESVKAMHKARKRVK